MNKKKSSKSSKSEFIELPSPEEEDFQSKIYSKREFYYHTIPQRPILKKYDEISKYRDDVCKGDFRLREQQIIPTNFLLSFIIFKT